MFQMRRIAVAEVLAVLVLTMVLPSCGQPSNYYSKLSRDCPQADLQCCLTSVKAMELRNYTVVPAAGCPQGFKPNMMRCPSSYQWCQPQAELPLTGALVQLP